MAVTLKGSTVTYEGLSTDDKPTNANVNDKFYELDTKDEYYYTGETWSKVGGDA